VLRGREEGRIVFVASLPSRLESTMPPHSGYVALVPMIAGPEGGPSSDMQRYEG
jgi:hypothetical protein